MHSFYKMIHAI